MMMMMMMMMMVMMITTVATERGDADADDQPLMTMPTVMMVMLIWVSMVTNMFFITIITIMRLTSRSTPNLAGRIMVELEAMADSCISRPDFPQRPREVFFPPTPGSVRECPGAVPSRRPRTPSSSAYWSEYDKETESWSPKLPNSECLNRTTEAPQFVTQRWLS